MVRSSLRLALVLLFSLPLAAQTKINPSYQINWPTCASGQAYEPFSNACVAELPTGTISTGSGSSNVLTFPGTAKANVFALPNSSAVTGNILFASPANDLQFGDLTNKFTSLSYWFGGNSYETVTSAGGVQFTLPVGLTQFSVNGSVNLTGAQGNGSSIQTYSTNAAVGPLCAAADGSSTTTGCTNGSTISLTTTGISGPATLSGGILNIPQYTGGAGIAYTSPAVNYIPVVTSTAGNGTVANSTFTDNAGQAAVGDPFSLGAGGSIAAQGTATSGQNYPCNPLALNLSYYNAGAVPDAYTLGCYVNTGTSPTTLVTLYGPSSLAPSVASNSVGFLLAQNAGLAAISTQNINSPKFKLRGAVYNGTGSSLQDWNIQAIESTGTNPASTLTISCTGTTGTCAVSAPAYTATGGTPGVKLTAAAFSTYPACASGTEGLEEAVTDSSTATWGATVTGSGTNHIKMYCDGTNWTVEAK